MKMISGGCMKSLEIDNYDKEGFPYVEIVEQPASKALRFRYECEGRSAGSIPGANSSSEYKTYPTIKICNYQGRGIVVVSCVTKDQPYRPHPHSLVGKGTCKTGVCRMEITPGHPIVSFVNLGIQCVKKKDIAEALSVREEIRVDPFRTGFDHKRQPSSVDLNAVRMCFQVFVEGREGKINVPLQPVVSQPIYDKKAMSDLMICKLSHYSGTVAGGMEMIMLCEKVAKDNIQVRFFEKRDGLEVWEGYGDFKSIDVHKQTAIAFRTPSYRYQAIEEPLPVYIQLKRPSDGATSEPLPFQYLPLGADDHDALRRKRRKFGGSPRAQVLRVIQAEAESQGIPMNEPIFECNTDPVRLEARVQSFPGRGVGLAFTEGVHSMVGNVGTPIQSPTNLLDTSVPSYGDQDSPVSLPSPAVGYSVYNAMHGGANHPASIINEEFESAPNNQGYPYHQQSFNRHQVDSSQFSNCFQQQYSHRQQAPALQKLTTSQQTQPRNAHLLGLESTINESDLLDIPGSNQASFDTSLNQLDSAELAAFSVALSETFSSGLSIIDHPVKIENNIATGTLPVSVGAAASWCDV
ncbi:embryonic polarity protein dorsal-like [Venturia canescens]|uniref:embryonic polarity protein dorsal-like n=1 Tax=Venturia canescens TaxID=32260 RepID=UPI001C9C173E|nr:embryonic polarity protein dorsal-like [Venturia canescens]XP_043289572.1 embryonic polarity protein dorsal-like [Venturia canescens]